MNAVENFKPDKTVVGWHFQRIFEADRDYSGISKLTGNSLSLALSYLTVYKIIDNILPLSRTGLVADIESAGTPEQSMSRLGPDKPKQWDLKVSYIRTSASKIQQPC